MLNNNEGTLEKSTVIPAEAGIQPFTRGNAEKNDSCRRRRGLGLDSLNSQTKCGRGIDAEIARTNDYSWRKLLPRAKSRRGWFRRAGQAASLIKDRVSLTERPIHIKNRREYGHWETDLMMLADKKHNLLVAQERRSRFTFIAKQTTKASQPTVDRLKDWLSPLPPALRRTLTQDNGSEFAQHHQLNPIGIKTY